MPRTTATAVRNIAKVKGSFSDTQLAPFIEASNFIVTQVCLTSDYDDVSLELIERWLAAHFYHVFDPRRSEEKADVIQAVFEGKSGLNLNFTRYGQQAMLLDVKGNLAALNREVTQGKKLVKATLAFIGGKNRGCCDPIGDDGCL